MSVKNPTRALHDLKLTGNLEMIEKIDEGIFMILEEVMEELLEENGYDIDDFENLLEEDEDDE